MATDTLVIFLGTSVLLFGLCWTPMLEAQSDVQPAGNHTPPCPSRCLCFETTVRCMFLRLTHIPNVPPETTTLDLRFNRIKHITANTFAGLINLSTLLLNNNLIATIDGGTFKELTNLRHLYLYKNRIKRIESDAFQGLGKLEQLYLHFNELEALEANTFSSLIKLERLFLHNNKLAHVPSEAFGSVSTLRRLRLDSNPIVCDCQILWLANLFKETQKTKLASATASVICEHPSTLRGKSLVALNQSSFQCNPSKPILMEEPNDVDISYGSTLYFTCKADGQPQPEIIWLHNESVLDMKKTADGRYKTLADGTLMIENAQETDEGFYECMAHNKMGEVKSRKAKMRRHAPISEVTIINEKENLLPRLRSFTPRRQNGERGRVSKRPKFIVTPTDQLVFRGNVVSLRCQAIGDPEPLVSWTKDNVPIVDSERLQTSSFGALTIDDADRTDSGTYRCVASNKLGKVFASAQVTVQAPPLFTEEPTDQVLAAGQTAKFTCRAEGDPAPKITWHRKGVVMTDNERISISEDGSVAVLRDVDKGDQTTYLCRAQNVAGTRDTGANLIIRDQDSPVFVTKPENQEVSLGDRAVFSCLATGNPQPIIEWRKDGELILIGGRRLFHGGGTLSVSNVVHADRGVYECRAVNGLGSSAAVAHLTVTNNGRVNSIHRTVPSISGSNLPDSRPTASEEEVRVSVAEARRLIDKAVNHTITELFDKNRTNRTPSDLMRLVRFPTPQRLQDAIKAAEIYEHALVLVRRYVQTGQELNVSNEFVPAHFLSPVNLQLITNLSGCLVHRRVPVCTGNICFHARYRSFNGSCNNFEHPLWGASEVALRRLLRPVYENGFNTPIGWNVGRPYRDNFSKPSARLVSTSVIRTQSITPDDTVTHMLMQWGQFLDHDLDMSPPTVSTESFLDGANCKTSCENAPPCFPIPIPENDHRIRTLKCMEFVRSSAVCGTGSTSVIYGSVAAREQLNILTSYIDASQVYGSSEPEAYHLRSRVPGSEGMLREGLITESGKPLLPFADDSWPTDCRRDSRESDVGCFIAGDFRVNEQLALIAMHTIWFREHNRLVKQLRHWNSHWDSDRLYHEARKIVGAQMQHITYAHWLPKVLGRKGMEMLGDYSGYDPTVDATISNEFGTAALRFGHTLINPVFHRLNATFKPIPQGHVHLRNAFFSPFRILEEGGIDPLLRGMFAVPAKLKTPSEMLNSELVEQLFRQVNQVALDLAAINIQRGRDHGLPSYTEYRRLCNLSVPETFDDLRHDIQDDVLRDKLKKVYGHPANVDLWVGGVCEDVIEEAKVGPTFMCILVDQFQRLRTGDRLYYENPGVFRSDQLVQLKKTSLSRIMCDNGDSIDKVTRDAFIVPEKQRATFIGCETIPREDYMPWLDCCDQGCGGNHNNQENTLPLRRQRRQTDQFSYPEDKPTAYFNETDDIRIEGVEYTVRKLEKTVHRLNKKLRLLESKCDGLDKLQAGCLDNAGRRRTDGETWIKDDCTQCSCQIAQVTCEVSSDCKKGS